MEKIANVIKIKLSKFGLSYLFFCLLIIFLPIQTRKIFFTPFSFYYGYHAFYNSLFIYLTDLIFLCLMVAWLWENLKGQAQNRLFHRICTKISQDRIYQVLVVFWLILAISVIFSREKSLGIYGLAKISEFLLIFAYLRQNIRFSREKLRISLVFWLILATLWFQSILGIVQYLGQSSLGFKILGEEFLRPGIKGIAEFVSSGVANPLFYSFFLYLSPISKITVNIRAYGTFPHPNVLAGLLFPGLILNLYLLYFSISGARKGVSFHVKTLILSLSLGLIITGLVVTFSRLAWLVSALAVFIWFFLIFVYVRKPEILAMRIGILKRDRAKYFPSQIALIVAVILVSLALNFFLFGKQIRDRLVTPTTNVASLHLENYNPSESLTFRQMFNQIAFLMIKRQPFLGVGLRNFVKEMDNYTAEKLLPFMHQPAHNIYLLIAAEAGIGALFIFLLFLYYIVRHAREKITNPILKYTLFIILFGFLFIGFFDHYLWTIQQGSLMFWIILGLLGGKGAK